MCPIVVNHCVDHAQAVKDTISKNNACTACSATGSSGDFNFFNQMFERKWTDKMKNLYYELLRDDRFKGLFNEKGFMLSQPLLDKVQKLFLGCRFLPNAWWDAFLYDVYCQTQNRCIWQTWDFFLQFWRPSGRILTKGSCLCCLKKSVKKLLKL